LRSALAEEERDARANAIVRTLVLVDLVRALAVAGIQAIVLKGPAVAMAAYDDYSRRTFGDIDLVLHRDDLAAARDFLIARGFVPDFPSAMESALIADQHALEFSDSRTRVELHWALLSRHLRFDIDPGALWADAAQLQCLGSEITVLSREHLFLYLCAHGAKHEWILFRWVLDVAQLVQRLDPAEARRIIALSERTNTRRILALALRIARETFGEEGSPFPASALLSDADTRSLAQFARGRLQPAGPEARELLPPRLARIHPYLGTLAFWIRSRERAFDRVACAASFFFIPAASDSSGGKLHSLLRPARLATRALRRIVQAS